MDLSNLKAAEGSVHSDNFRRGRGHGSGNGKTAGKGHKGQKARSGAPRPGFEGGQMPLYRRLPKRGFKNINTLTIVPINLSALERFDNDAVVSVETLIEAGIVKNPRDGVKILGNGELTKKLTVQANAFSASAKEKIEALGFTGSGEGISSQAICALTSVSNYIYGEADMKNCCSGCNGCTKYQE